MQQINVVMDYNNVIEERRHSPHIQLLELCCTEPRKNMPCLSSFIFGSHGAAIIWLSKPTIPYRDCD